MKRRRSSRPILQPRCSKGSPRRIRTQERARRPGEAKLPMRPPVPAIRVWSRRDLRSRNCWRASGPWAVIRSATPHTRPCAGAMAGGSTPTAAVVRGTSSTGTPKTRKATSTRSTPNWVWVPEGEDHAHRTLFRPALWNKDPRRGRALLRRCHRAGRGAGGAGRRDVRGRDRSRAGPAFAHRSAAGGAGGGGRGEVGGPDQPRGAPKSPRRSAAGGAGAALGRSLPGAAVAGYLLARAPGYLGHLPLGRWAPPDSRGRPDPAGGPDP